MAIPASSQQHFIGVDLCEPTLRAAIVTDSGDLLESREAPLDLERVVEQVAQIVSELRDVAPNVQSVGVAIPGLVNRFTDRVLASTELPSTVREDLHGKLMKATGLRIELENDANAAAYGEYKVGAGRGCRDMFYMSISKGIGGAIIFDGKLWAGASGLAGEVGRVCLRQYRLFGNSRLGAEHRAARSGAFGPGLNLFAFPAGPAQRIHRG